MKSATIRAKTKTKAAAERAAFPQIIDIVRSFQRRNRTKPRIPRRGDRIGFAFATMDRYLFTLQTLESLDAEGGFDLVWNDGSREQGVPSLSKNYRFRNARLVEVNYRVGGGPDAAICYGLKRLLALGYDYVGLIENDILFRPGWFTRLVELFSLGASEGLVCGSATVRSFESHVLEYRSGYSIRADIGAGMVLFSRPAAEIIVDLYSTPSGLQMTTHSWLKFYADYFGLELRPFSPFWAYPPEKAFPCTPDWGYTPSLYLRGYASLSSIPTYATDLEFDVETFFHTRYVGEEKNGAGVAYPRLPLALPIR